MKTLTGADFWEELIQIHHTESPPALKYPPMRALLLRACKSLTAGESMQFPSLFARLNYLCRQTGLDSSKTVAVNDFRIAANKVMHNGYLPTAVEYAAHLRALCEALSHFWEARIPEILQAFFPEIMKFRPTRRPARKHARIRVEVRNSDDQFIYAFDEEHTGDTPVRIRYRTHGEAENPFAETAACLWPGCRLNLLDVAVDSEGIYIPELIILEPDYLIDVSALAECVKEYSRHPLHFLRSRLEPSLNNRHILLGNIANLFLDEMIHEKPHAPVLFKEVMQKAFRAAPFEFAACNEIDAAFFADAQTQFNNIRNIVQKVFPQTGIDPENALLEPHFICEQLGVQGRLDFLQRSAGKHVVIELKSGKAPFPETQYQLIGVNHQSQTFLYQIIIQKILGVAFRDLDTFICYSKYTDPRANLRLSAASMAAIKELLVIRNRIVANEHAVARDPSGTTAKALLQAISPDNLITHGTAVKGSFLEKYIIPQINQFGEPFRKASLLEKEYFHAFYAFVAREHYISKAGDTDYEGVRGVSSLWLSSLEEKTEAGEILTDLTILENRTETEDPFLRLSIPAYDHDFLPNFRTGDIVILYERNAAGDGVGNRQIFKAAVQAISPTEVTLRVRYKQRNPSVLPQQSRYAIEHDFLDSTYTAQYRGLYAFLNANQDRKDLLLGQRAPRTIEPVALEKACENEAMARIVRKAKSAEDYFLLLGPPGTGKTSLALKALVEAFHRSPDTNILLLSYTNRAVDEICDALDRVEGSPAYVRIGPELTCAPKHRKRLLDKMIGHCNRRDEVRDAIGRHRIFVGTVASLSGKTELFKLKQFGVAIVDEASQILEPSLLGLLSAKDPAGRNAIGRFILIGDHKQLPAVVLQSEAESEVKNPLLRAIGLTDRRDSLFERLFRLHQQETDSPHWEMLCRHGRMHPDIARFPNEAFYNGKLEAVPTQHQSEALDFRKFDAEKPVQHLLATRRLAFIPSEKYPADKTAKTNTCEAQIIVKLLAGLWELCCQNDLLLVGEEPAACDPEKARKISVGIITPYRAQIALIRRAIHALNIPALADITIDTVERFQGSQRDVIIYSFCVNQAYQLELLSQVLQDADGQPIDRKLNVAITRAKKQFFVTGNPALLRRNEIYRCFLDSIDAPRGVVEITSENEAGRRMAELVD